MRKLVETTDTLRQDLGRIVRALADVDHIASNHSIPALNAKIEAVHIGERGASFGIVAQEIQAQAHKSRAITEDIRQTALRLTGAAQTTESEISRLACADQQTIAQLQVEVREALEHLESAYGNWAAR